MIGCRADGLRSLRERYAVVARRACEKPISRCGKRVKHSRLRGRGRARPCGVPAGRAQDSTFYIWLTHDDTRLEVLET